MGYTNRKELGEIKKLDNLKELYLYNNNLISMEGIENLKKLEVNNYIREIKKIDNELSEITKQKTILAKELNEKEVK